MRVITFILALLLFISNFAQQSYNFKLFTTNEGLINNNCYQLFQDSKGYLWVANGSGVSRFNGKKFENFIDKSNLNWDVNQFYEKKLSNGKKEIFVSFLYWNYCPESATYEIHKQNLTDGLVPGKEDLGKLPFQPLVDKNSFKIFPLNLRGNQAYDTIYYLKDNTLSYCLIKGHTSSRKTNLILDNSKNIYVVIDDTSSHAYFIYSFDKGKLSFLRRSIFFPIIVERLPNDLIFTVCSTDAGLMKSGFYLKDGKPVFETTFEPLGSGPGNQHVISENDIVWIPYKKGLLRMSPAGKKEFIDNDRNYDYETESIFDRNGKQYTVRTEFDGNYQHLISDGRGNLVNGDRLFDGMNFHDLLDFKILSTITHSERSFGKPKKIKLMICDREENIWISTDEGLIRFSPVPFREPKTYLSKKEVDFKLKFVDNEKRNYYIKKDEKNSNFHLKVYKDTQVIYDNIIRTSPLSAKNPIQEILQFAQCGKYCVMIYNNASNNYSIHFLDGKKEKTYNVKEMPRLLFSMGDTVVLKIPAGEGYKPDWEKRSKTLIFISPEFTFEKEISSSFYRKLSNDIFSDYVMDYEDIFWQPQPARNYAVDQYLTKITFAENFTVDTCSYGGLPLNVRYNILHTSEIRTGPFKLLVIDKDYNFYLCNDHSFQKLRVVDSLNYIKKVNFSNTWYPSEICRFRDFFIFNCIYSRNPFVYRFDSLNNRLIFFAELSYAKGLTSHNNFFSVENNYLAMNSPETDELLIVTYEEFLTNKLKKPVRIRLPRTYPAMQTKQFDFFANCLTPQYFNKKPPLINISQITFVDKILFCIDSLDTHHYSASITNLTFHFDAVTTADGNYIQAMYNVIGLDTTWQDINSDNIKFPSLPPGSYTLQIKACNNHNYWSEPKQLAFSVDYPWYRTWTAYTGYLVIGFGSVFGFIRVRTRQLENEKKKLEQIVIDRTTEIREQKHLIEEKNKEITDSINYAQKIQSTLMASKTLLDNYLVDKINGRDYFIFYQPKDIVSGDYYWAFNPTDKKDEFILITADCTGHGVPGAFMSLLCISYLNEIVKEQKITQPHLIFNQVRDKIVNNFRAHENPERKDGMDAVLCKFNFKNNSLDYAAGNNPVVVVEPNDKGTYELKELDYDKMPVGVSHNSEYPPFKHFNYQLRKGSIVYTFTDGFADQFGGPKGKKFMYRKLRDLILSNAHLSMEEQKDQLKKAINDWMGENEQVDDICVIGILI